MKHLFIYTTFLLGLSTVFLSCDSTTSPRSPFPDSPSIESLNITPPEINFSLQQDGYKDTTVTFTILSQISDIIGNQNPRFFVSLKSSGESVSEGELSPSNSQQHNYGAEVNINTTTTSIENYIVSVFLESNPDNYAQTGFKVNGFPNNPPTIIEVNNPEEVTIPNEGETTDVFFTAKVNDLDGQNNIDQVLIEFLNEDGSKLIPEPNKLLDDGNSGPDGSGDQVAGDSVYTIAFTITSANTPNNRTAQYFAIDKAGLSSDTVETSFNIVE